MLSKIKKGLKSMNKDYNKTNLTRIFLLLFIFAMLGKPKAVNAAAVVDEIELDKNYTVQIQDYDDAFLYEFSVPEAGNINIQAKNIIPAGSGEVNLQLFDSNNSALTDTYYGSKVNLPVYPTNGGRTFYLSLSSHYTDEATFLLTVNFQPTTDWETEGNDTTAEADVITAGKEWYGALSDRESDDFFKFCLDADKKVAITFGPKEVSGQDDKWDVYLVNSSNEYREIYDGDSRTQTYTCYLKKGNYYLQVKNHYSAPGVIYALSYKESALNLAEPTIVSMKLTGHDSWSSYVELSNIRIKNPGNATGYTVKVAKNASMKGKLVTEDIDLEDTNTKKQVSLRSSLFVFPTYYVQVRSYVADPFDVKIYGKYGSVNSKSLKKSVYRRLKK